MTELRFPPDIAYGSAGGPEYSTDVVASQGGWEQRNANWANARCRFNVASGVKTKEQLTELIAFFRICQGRATAFRFRDWSDFATEGLVGTGDGGQTEFRLSKRYALNGVTSLRPITHPLAETLVVSVNGVVKSSGFTLLSGGVLHFNQPPANGAVVSAAFEFDVWVRFNTDRLSNLLQSYGVFSTTPVELVEVRV